MRASRLYALVAAVLAAATPSLAQTNTTPLPPFVYPLTVGTSPAQILPFQDRRSVEFCNPNASITCAVCPQISAKNSAVITCAINGAGSVTLPPSYCWGKSGAPPSLLNSAWNGVCSSSGNLTAFEIR